MEGGGIAALEDPAVERTSRVLDRLLPLEAATRAHEAEAREQHPAAEAAGELAQADALEVLDRDRAGTRAPTTPS